MWPSNTGVERDGRSVLFSDATEAATCREALSTNSLLYAKAFNAHNLGMVELLLKHLINMSSEVIQWC